MSVMTSIMLSCFRMPVERSHLASTTQFVSQDLQTRDIDVCAILDSRANTATRVHVTCLVCLFAFFCFVLFCFVFFFRRSAEESCSFYCTFITWSDFML